MKNVFPKNYLNSSSEVYRYKFLKRSNKIYLILILLLLSVAVSLPLIKVDIYKSAPGIIRSEKSQSDLPRSIEGRVSKFKHLDIHNSLYSGSSISEISPQTDLFVECYISPKEIGSFKDNLSVQFQIDVFDYRQWGMASGAIKNIANKITFRKGVPVFKVICSLNESVLFLNEFAKGELKNGMTLKAFFLDRNSSLFHLLFDQADDWFYSKQG
jgi:HlyD family secretion protein